MGRGQRLIAFALLVLCAAPVGAACDRDRVDLRGDWGEAEFRVEVADSHQARARGLMFREDLARSAGMLFVYERPQALTFWMKNTLIPLDIIFADAQGVVRYVHENAQPQDLTHISGGRNLQYVLEINGGMTSILGIDVGSELRHPAIAQDIAAWGCSEE
ncbi:MAG: DUF192 domain-containing protein [Rhodobacteraceae bacterium]|nr:DUF192 domain-containing protein [Paracoccaceae bacterium]